MHTLPNPRATSNPNCKPCKKCKAVKPLTEFHRHRSRPDGLHWQCKVCVRATMNAYREKNPEKVRSWDRARYVRDKPKRSRLRDEHRAKNLEKYRQYMREYNVANREKLQAYRRKYLEENGEAVNAKRREQRLASPEKHRKQIKKSYEKHRAKRLADMRAYAKANRHKWPEYGKRYRKRHKLYLSAKSLKRMAVVRGLPSDFTEGDIAFGLSFWRSACAVCGTPFGLIEKTHWDHWIPLSDQACPGTVPENMIPLCSFCNTSKGGRRGPVFLERLLGEKKAKVRGRKVAAFFAAVRKRE